MSDVVSLFLCLLHCLAEGAHWDDRWETDKIWCRALVQGSVLAFLGEIQVTTLKNLTGFGNNE